MPLCETAESFGDAPAVLRGVLHWPTDAAPRGGLVLCGPFGEERRCCGRVLTLAGRAFCERGLHVLRFDYYGTGESDGEHLDATIPGWLADIERARVHLATRAGLSSVGLLGVRFGATLATLLPATTERLPFLILWAPILSGARCLEDCHQRLAATQLVAEPTADGRIAPLVICDTEACDLGGYPLSRTLQKEIEPIELPRDASSRADTAVIASVSWRGELPALHAELGKRLVGSTGVTESFGFRGRPFWATASRWDPRLLVQRTLQVLEIP